MDSMHDLGGKEGFGPIDTGKGDQPFEFDWERRMWAMARGGVFRDATIDWFRHCLELMVPGDYLTYRYFQKWATIYLLFQIDNGVATMEETLSGHIATPAPKADVKSVAEVLEANRASCVSFEVEATTPPRFNIGNSVTTQRFTHSGHTRLPAYARDRTGEVIAHHGAHLLADEGAKGNHVGEHLYTVAFSATELWGPEANPRDSVTLELWESYLV